MFQLSFTKNMATIHIKFIVSIFLLFTLVLTTFPGSLGEDSNYALCPPPPPPATPTNCLPRSPSMPTPTNCLPQSPSQPTTYIPPPPSTVYCPPSTAEYQPPCGSYSYNPPPWYLKSAPPPPYPFWPYFPYYGNVKASTATTVVSSFAWISAFMLSLLVTCVLNL